jgi:CheY-like chemotaxis protein
MQAIGQLAGGVAHDFNNLLTAVAGNLELLEQQVTHDTGRRLLRTAMRAVDRGAQLTHRLLAFSRKQHLQPKPVDINRLTSGMGDLVARTLGGTIQVRMALSGGLWPALVDPTQIELALLNLAINARDAMPDVGILTISTRNAHVTTAADDLAPGDYVVVAVTDIGTGMAEDVLARAFEPFFTTKEIGKGTGLGLSQVYGFIQQSGGKVAIESKLGAGTTVRLCLPCAAEEAVAETISGIAQAVTGATRAVLLVDDEADVRATIAATLREHEYEVLEASDGSAAIDWLMSGASIDLVICDVAMPGGVTGVEVAREARRLRPAVKVLLISGDPSAVIETATGAPEFARLSKPFRQADLMRELGAMLAS